MQKTKISWVLNPDGSSGHTSNPIKGLCKGGCPYCYARGIYKRFKWNPEVRFDHKEKYKWSSEYKKTKGIFIGSMHDIFGDWVPNQWIEMILQEVRLSNNRFYFLTKNPARYLEFDFPKNCWLGVTVTEFEDIYKIGILLNYNHKGIKFVSYEPMLEKINLNYRIYRTDWLIIGPMTKNGRIVKEYQPKKEWIEEIVSETRRLNVPLFMKNKLSKIWQDKLIQEFPK